MRAVLCLLSIFWVMSPSAVVALGRGDVVLGFGESYSTTAGASRVHHGVDVAAAVDGAVESPVDGTVAFAGRVPGPDGDTVLAVTIVSDRGSVTLLPLASVRVDKGTNIGAGEEIGSVAASGDPSSPEPHVHLGLRAGSLYLDPTALLAAPPAAVPVPQAVPVAAPAPQAAPAAASPPPVMSTSVASGPALEIGTVPAAVPEVAAQAAPQVQGDTGAQGVIAGQPGVALAPLASAPPVRSAVPVDLAGAGARGAAWLAANPLGLVCVLFAAVVSAFLLTRRAVERAVCFRAPVSDRLGMMLQQLRAGDTLCGLISCSGHDAFTVPGPPAQRR